MTSASTRFGLTLLLAAGLTACGSKPADEAPPAVSALVELQPAATRSLRQTLIAYGTADFAASASITVPVTVESQVAALLTHAGAQVNQGDPLLRLVPSPATRLDLDKAERDARLAEAEATRMRRQRDDGLATESELQTAVNAAGTATKLRDSLQARTGPGRQLILRAPHEGIVDLLAVQPGDVLAPGTVAARIASGTQLVARLGIEAGDMPRVATGQTVNLTPLSQAATTVATTIAKFDHRVEQQSRQAAAMANVPASAHLLPGTALRGEIVIATHADAIAVPLAALLFVDDAPQLFVAVNGKAQKRDVKTGFRDGGFVEVTDGLKAGEAVVVAGNAVLEDGMAVRTADADTGGTAKPEAP